MREGYYSRSDLLLVNAVAYTYLTDVLLLQKINGRQKLYFVMVLDSLQHHLRRIVDRGAVAGVVLLTRGLITGLSAVVLFTALLNPAA